jgi:hypothetical protein
MLAAAVAVLLVFSGGIEARQPSDKLSQGQVGFRGTIERIGAAQAERMTGVSWRPGCPVPLATSAC